MSTDLKRETLTSISPGGGCLCKLPQEDLHLMMESIFKSGWRSGRVLIGAEDGDDAAVMTVTPGHALVMTTDFGTPIVDRPDHWGRIAAAHAASDVYAMGGRPIAANAIVGVSLAHSRQFEEAQAAAAAAFGDLGVSLVGGHTIVAERQPLLGYCVVGEVDPARILRKAGLRPGDDLVLTKPLGIGLYMGALRTGNADHSSYDELVSTAATPNVVGHELANRGLATGATDITGWGLLAELYSLCKAAKVGIELHLDQVPILAKARAFAQIGLISSGGLRNGLHVPESVMTAVHEDLMSVLLDPQTGGGLLISCRPQDTAQVIELAKAAGSPMASRIGCTVEGDTVHVTSARDGFLRRLPRLPHAGAAQPADQPHQGASGKPIGSQS